MSILDPLRPVFLDGERLTARRLNAGFEYLRTWLRRTLLGPLSPGVALGLTLTTDPADGTVLVAPGIAIERRGRLVVLSTALRASRDEITSAVGTTELQPGDVVRIGIGLSTSASPLDPCATSGRDAYEQPKLYFRKLDVAEAGVRVNIGAACVEPWGDLGGPSPDLFDGCSVQLGTVEVDGENALVVSMDARQGIAPRVDALRNSYDEVVAELRARNGAARAYFVAPAGGPDVQATKIAKDIEGAPPAATYSHGSPNVLELGGGTVTGVVGVGRGGVAAIPLVVSPAAGSILAGTVLELITDSPTIPQVRPITSPENAFGIAVGNSYPSGPQVVPLGVAGLVEVDVDATEFGLDAGTPLSASDAQTLTKAGPGDRVVAILGVRIDAPAESVPVFVVHPTYALPAVTP